MHQGIFITLEGGEGVGKSTQARLLQKELSKRGIQSIVTREPGGSPLGEALRNVMVHTQNLIPTEELFIVLAARLYHVRTVIQPALDQGTWVICDRFIDSTLVYQGLVHNLGTEWIWQWHQRAGITLKPNLTFLLHSPLDISLKRRQRNVQACNKFDHAETAFHERIHRGFQTLSLRYSKRFIRIRASAPVPVVTKMMIRHLETRFAVPTAPSGEGAPFKD
jgi:dTMP kinase